MAKREPKGEMTLAEHLGELRYRMIVSLVAIAVGGVVAFAAFEPILHALVAPYREVTGKESLIFTEPLEAFLTRLKVAGYGGLFMASPVLLWQFWRFVTPGLQAREKRYAIPFVMSSIVLFAAGSWLAITSLPRTLDFLLSMGGGELEPLLTAGRYLSFTALMILAFGVAFEFPVVLMFLLLARVIKTRQLRRVRRHAIVGIVAFSAVITPSQDPYTLFFMAGPMYVLFEGSILLGRILKR